MLSEDLDPTSDTDTPDMDMDSTVVMPVMVPDMVIHMVVMLVMVVMDTADLLPQRFQCIPLFQCAALL